MQPSDVIFISSHSTHVERVSGFLHEPRHWQTTCGHCIPHARWHCEACFYSRSRCRHTGRHPDILHNIFIHEDFEARLRPPPESNMLLPSAAGASVPQNRTAPRSSPHQHLFHRTHSPRCEQSHTHRQRCVNKPIPAGLSLGCQVRLGQTLRACIAWRLLQERPTQDLVCFTAHVRVAARVLLAGLHHGWQGGHVHTQWVERASWRIVLRGGSQTIAECRHNIESPSLNCLYFPSLPPQGPPPCLTTPKLTLLKLFKLLPPAPTGPTHPV